MISEQSRPHLIFSYGTLKQGFHNHTLMQDLIRQNDAAFHSTWFTNQPHPLVCGPYGIPYLINLPGIGHLVKGELYSVSTPGLTRLDELEGLSIGHYERLPVRVGNGDLSIQVEAYFAHRSFGEGLWKRKGEVGLTEFTEKEACDYVKRADRPESTSIVDEIRLFVDSAGNEHQ
ncbi:Gamma-glutamylcyclotransferase, AIG2-like [Quillaja saponaria]|uniref:Gamma-glutamylcyclotransferase family protein n=1 Tax=Quillaja saponaria TaxID=32244 RepID=A0AAD7L896_QUISA|nr:Gamma-glutamylcyclotransferase, AIG2-like [Quillaja saponaria]